jgi:hypothetical protein
MRIITLEDLHRHVLDLWGKEDGIEWIDKILSPVAHLESGTIRIHQIHSETAYAVALHEIGHIRGGSFEDLLTDEDLLTEERRAWAWAKANALVWTPTMQREAERCMGAYEADEAHLTAYYYGEILKLVCDLLAGNIDGPQVCDALIRNATELAEIYEYDGDARKARRMLICLINKYSAAEASDAG